MTVRVPLPGGAWADLKTPADLNGADQDDYFAKYEEILDAKPAAPPRPDPDNPAVMLPAEAPKMANRDWRTLRDHLLGMVITGWSFDLPLPYTAESKRGLSLPATNALYEAVRPVQRAMNGDDDAEGEGPKPGAQSGGGGSGDTSQGSTPSPLPESGGELLTTQPG